MAEKHAENSVRLPVIRRSIQCNKFWTLDIYIWLSFYSTSPTTISYVFW